jgi:TolB-like protein
MLRDGLTAEEVSHALTRLLSAPDFQASERNKRFLRYVVEETLADRGERIKSYSIAVDVFGRGADFDGASDSIVRTEATRLRGALTKYYVAAGAEDPIRILLSPGSYMPQFVRTVPASSTRPPVAGSSLTAPSPASGLRIFSRRVWLSVAAFLIASLLLLLAGQSLRHWLFSPRASIRPLIVLAPTQPIGDEAKVRYLALGLGQSLVTVFTRYEGLSVAQTNKRMPVDAIVARRRALGGAVYVLESSIDMDGERLRFRWSLIPGDGGTILWSDQIDEALSDSEVLKVEDRIAEGVARIAVGNNGIVIHAEQSKQTPRSTVGYACILRALGYLARKDAAAHAEARDCLEATVAQSSDDHEAWALLAYLYIDESREGFNPRGDKQEIIERAEAASERAENLAPRSPLVQQMRSAVLFYKGDFPGFERAGRKSVELNPRDPEGLVLFGNRLFRMGRYDEGIALVRQGLAMEPFSQAIDHAVSLHDFYRLGNYKAAAEEAETLAPDPDYYPMFVSFAAIYGQLGDKARASAYLARVLRLQPDYAKKFRADWRNRGYQPDLIDKLAEGLRKAGLPVQ